MSSQFKNIEETIVDIKKGGRTMPKKMISETYTRKQVSNIVKNIFIHLRKNIEDFTSDYGDYYSAVFEKDLDKIEKNWVKKYD